MTFRYQASTVFTPKIRKLFPYFDISRVYTLWQHGIKARSFLFFCVQPVSMSSKIYGPITQTPHTPLRVCPYAGVWRQWATPGL